MSPTFSYFISVAHTHTHKAKWAGDVLSGAVPTQNKQTEQTVFHCRLLCIVSVFDGNTGVSSYHIHTISH